MNEEAEGELHYFMIINSYKTINVENNLQVNRL